MMSHAPVVLRAPGSPGSAKDNCAWLKLKLMEKEPAYAKALLIIEKELTDELAGRC